jgi:hypothetical protein
MKKTITGVLIGILLSAALFIPLLVFERKDHYEFGRNTGHLNGKVEAWEFLDTYFKTDQAPAEVIDSFGAKDLSIYVVEENGALTIKTH